LTLNSELLNLIQIYNIEIVKEHNPVQNPKDFLEMVASLENQEGFVIAWDDGYRVKCKSSWYVNIHKAKENILREKGVIEMLLNEKSDDVKPFLIEEDRRRLEEYEDKFWHGVGQTIDEWKRIDADMRNKYSRDRRKEFALNDANTLDSFLKSAIFKAWDNPNYDWREAVLSRVRLSLSSQAKIDETRHLWNNVKWSMVDAEM